MKICVCNLRTETHLCTFLCLQIRILTKLMQKDFPAIMSTIVYSRITRVLRSSLSELFKNFDSRERVWDSFEFFRYTITSIDVELISVTQSVIIYSLRPFPEDGTFEQLKSAPFALLWACQARSDVAFAAHCVA